MYPKRYILCNRKILTDQSIVQDWSLFGVIICAISVGIFKIAALGVSTYDAVALIICNTWKKGRFLYVRIITDLVCVLTGTVLFLLSGGKPLAIPTIAGIGTIITAFFMGPLIEFFNVRVARPFLNYGGKDSSRSSE